MRKGSNKGFTLIELLIVIAIIGILAAVLIPNLLSARTRAQSTAGQAYAREVLLSLESLQSTDSTVSYSETAALTEIVVDEVIQEIDLGAGPRTFAATAVAEALKAPTNGVSDAWYDPTTDVITVQQTINNVIYCHVLDTTSNSLSSTNNGTTDCL